MLSDLFIKEIALKKDKIKNHEEYPFNLQVVQHLDKLEINKNVTFLIGENGCGKSTLLEAIAINIGFNPEGGSKKYKFYSYNTHSILHEYLTVVKGFFIPKDGFFLRSESFYNVESYIEKLDKENPGGPPIKDVYGGSLHEQSHGESVLSLIKNRFRGNGIYILDEPESALSPIRLLSLMVLINDLVKTRSQFLIATHSPILLAFPKADIIVLDENGFSNKKYYETEHYLLTKQFLDNPERMLNELLR